MTEPVNDIPSETIESHHRSEPGLSRRSFLFTLVSTLALGLATESRAALTPVKPFTFAFVSDIHLTLDKEDTHQLFKESQLFYQQFVKRINERNPDFVIFGGDQVSSPGEDESNWNLFLDIAQGLNCPWYFVLGEDDISGPRPVDKMRTFGPDLKGKGIESETPYWSLSPAHNVHLIGLDTSRPGSNSGYVTAEQLKWLENDLKENESKLTIVFSHHPLLAPPPYETGPPFSDYLLSNAASVREILGSSPYVKLVLSGHVPVNHVQKEAGIYHVSCPSLVTYPCAFKIFTVSGDEISMETHQIDYKALVKKAEKALLDSSLAHHYNRKKPIEFLKLCQGGKTDNDAILPLYGGMTPVHAKSQTPVKSTNENAGKTEKKGKKKRFSIF